MRIVNEEYKSRQKQTYVAHLEIIEGRLNARRQMSTSLSSHYAVLRGDPDVCREYP
jgi:hypothetical protein